MIFNSKLYDCLKWISLVLLPACATLYGALAPTWSWPFAEEVVYTITAVDAFLGCLLGISNLQYKINNQEKEEAEDE